MTIKQSEFVLAYHAIIGPQLSEKFIAIDQEINKLIIENKKLNDQLSLLLSLLQISGKNKP